MAPPSGRRIYRRESVKYLLALLGVDLMKAVSRRRFLRLSAAAGGAALVAACAPATAPIVPDAPARPIRGGTVRVGVQSSGNSDYAGGRNIARAMYDSLIRSDQKGNLTGELAESWQISD